MIATSFSQFQYSTPAFKGLHGNFYKKKPFNFEKNIKDEFVFKASEKIFNKTTNESPTSDRPDKEKIKESMKEFLRKMREADDARRAQEAADAAKRFREAQEEARRSREQARAKQDYTSQNSAKPKPTPREVFAQHGVTLSAFPTQDELKKAYIELAKKLHPDKHPPEEREKYDAMMRTVVEAYQELKG